MQNPRKAVSKDLTQTLMPGLLRSQPVKFVVNLLGFSGKTLHLATERDSSSRVSNKESPKSALERTTAAICCACKDLEDAGSAELALAINQACSRRMKLDQYPDRCKMASWLQSTATLPDKRSTCQRKSERASTTWGSVTTICSRRSPSRSLASREDEPWLVGLSSCTAAVARARAVDRCDEICEKQKSRSGLFHLEPTRSVQSVKPS